MAWRSWWRVSLRGNGVARVFSSSSSSSPYSSFSAPPIRALSSLLPSIQCSVERSPSSLRNQQIVECLFRAERRFSTQAWVDPPAGAVVEVPLAQTGEGIAECELLTWFVEEGEVVEEFQRLCEVQSDKATIEITSRFKGKVHQILFVPGDVVKVGETLLKIFVQDNNVLDTYDSTDSGTTHANATEFEPNSSLSGPATSVGVLCTPAIRHLAKEFDLNLIDIPGSGLDGRITKEDVLNYASRKGISIPHVPHSSTEEREGVVLDSSKSVDLIYKDKVVPLRGFQRSMVKSMTLASKVPHFHYLEEINCDALIELKGYFQKVNSDPDIKHTFMPFLVKSLSLALSKYPILNSSLNEETNEVILKGSHNIGVAMDTPYGLVVPNVKQVQSLSIMEITIELVRLHKLASANKLSSEDITGGTITLSNIGAIGGKFGSPLLNLPEVAIIAIGRIQKLPRFAEDGTIYPASLSNFTVGADHRVVDGATVARFCNEWKRLVEKPELLLLQMR